MRKLQAALQELTECRKLLDGALADGVATGVATGAIVVLFAMPFTIFRQSIEAFIGRTMTIVIGV